MRDVPPGQDEGWLFVSGYGGQVDQLRFLKSIKRIIRFARISEEITLHSLRRYSLNRYTKLDADFVREVHDSVPQRPDRIKTLLVSILVC
jgi:site-specific recombinase XerD